MVTRRHRFLLGGFVLSQGKLVKVGERVVPQGDHTHVPKDGRRMPGVVTLHQDSETQSKPSYFRGHCRGAIAGLAGSLSAPFGIPLDLGMHQGFEHLGKKKEKNKSETLGTRIVPMAMDFCQRRDLIFILTLDAFFPGKNVFDLANAVWSVKFRKPMVSLIVRAKRNRVAYFEPSGKQDGRGRKRKYGMKVVLTELFDHAEMFEKAKCSVYGKAEEISITAANLPWRPTGDMIRFVLARTSRGPIVLMRNDLAIDPVAALLLYCARTRIEIAFDMPENPMGAFRYRFRGKGLPLHSRKPKKNAKLKCPGPAGAQPIFQVLAERHERAPVIVTTNTGFGDWTQIFGDANLTAALLDRITHKAHVIDCAWESYRLKETLKNRRRASK